MENKLVSIVVPIYNVGKYLDECISSIQNQTYHNIEIILVDDGSTDDSGIICDRYKGLDNRIKVIHQKNGGLTVARRNGVNISKGEYVGFVDGDDWIDPNMYKFMIDKACTDSSDIVTIGIVRELEGYKSILGDSIPTGKYKIDSEDQYIVRHVFSEKYNDIGRLNGSLCTKIIRRDILVDVLNEIDDSVNGYMDDSICVCGCLVKADYITSTQEIFYHHREYSESFTYRKNKKGLIQINNAFLELERIVKNSKFRDVLYPQMMDTVIFNTFDAFSKMFDEKVEIPKYFFKSSKVPLDSNIIIYGAGAVGMSFYKQFQTEGKYKIKGILDKYPNKSNGVVDIEQIHNYEYDYIIIAVKDEKLANKIRGELIQKGISITKMVWEMPMAILEYYGC